MRIEMQTIDHAKQRYPTVGDWWFSPSFNPLSIAMLVRVSKMPDWRYEFLVGIHEMIEAGLCKYAGVHEDAVTAFDEAYEARRQPDDLSEPGDDEAAPYHRQHQLATEIERRLAQELGVDWERYEAIVNGL